MEERQYKLAEWLQQAFKDGKLPPTYTQIDDEKMTPLQIRRSITSSKFAQAFYKANP